MLERASGILLHPTSFPGGSGIGDLGDGAYRFIDWMAVARQRAWQVMPLGVTGYGDSPYASPSAFAGNPLLVSLDWLKGAGFLTDDDLSEIPPFPEHMVDFGGVIPVKHALLRRAFGRWVAAGGDRSPEYERFCLANRRWLDDFALFMAIKSAHGGAPWLAWERPIRLREAHALADWRERLTEDVGYHTFVQFQFMRQWEALRRYANERDIAVIGDVPIFVALDSADVWANRSLFQLDDEGRPTVVSGVPPDYFSATGQLWGNPVFDWSASRATGYAWWVDRVARTLELVDIIRIDHFRGFAASWSVPAGSETAAGGYWTRGPGEDLFIALREALGKFDVIVEDLGLITSDVDRLRDRLGYPGMKVLQFAFGEDPTNAYLPHNYERPCVVYTGTHDNDTTIGWFQSLDVDQRRAVQRYLGRDGSDIAWDLIRTAQESVANLSIVPLQDVMRLGSEARMNRPGQAVGNWGWRYQEHQLHEGLAQGLAELTHTYGRARRDARPRGHDPFDYTAEGTAHPLDG